MTKAKLRERIMQKIGSSLVKSLSSDSLTIKQRQFVSEYLIDLNGSAAYRRAGYRCKNDNVARVEAHRLLMNPNVKQAIDSALQARQSRRELDADYVEERLMKEAEREGEGASHAARIRAAELLGKRISYFPAEERTVRGHLVYSTGPGLEVDNDPKVQAAINEARRQYLYAIRSARGEPLGCATPIEDIGLPTPAEIIASVSKPRDVVIESHAVRAYPDARNLIRGP